MKQFFRSIGLGLLIFVLPPAALAWRRGFGLHFTVGLLLTLAGYVPGLIYAFGVLLLTDKETVVVSSEVTVERDGSVYVLTNSALSNVVKIGYTTRSAEKRARELSGTGVPGKWQVAHEISTGSPKQVEKTVHQKLSRQKVRDGGEFFEVSPEKAARVVKSVAQS